MSQGVPLPEIGRRLGALQEYLASADIDGALLVYPIDVYYYAGSRQNAALWVPSEGPPTLLVRKSYVRATAETGIGDVRPFPASRELPAFFSRNVKRIGMTFDVIPVLQYQFYSGLLSGREFVDISPKNREIRSVKSGWELQQMRGSGRLLCSAFAQVPDILRRGMTELDLAAAFEYLLRKSGSDGYLRIRAFNQEIVGLAVAGENAALPGCFDGPVTGKGLSGAAPFGPSRDPIREGSPILIDYGVIFNGYIVDMTRIFAFGKLERELNEAFDLAVRIQEWVAGSMIPGSTGEGLFAVAAELAASSGMGDRFMGFPGEQARFVGHGVGLELDELPVLAPRFTAPLREGQTVAVEPKFVFPGAGVVGIENTYAVSGTGCEKITDFPDHIVYL